MPDSTGWVDVWVAKSPPIHPSTDQKSSDRIELFQLVQDSFNFSDLTWPHPSTHQLGHPATGGEISTVHKPLNRIKIPCIFPVWKKVRSKFLVFPAPWPPSGHLSTFGGGIGLNKFCILPKFWSYLCFRRTWASRLPRLWRVDWSGVTSLCARHSPRVLHLQDGS